jgi:hypothetical protein
VQSGSRSSTGELLINFCYIFTIIGVVTFIICFSLQKKYKEELAKKLGKDFKYEEEPIDSQAICDSRGGQAHGW